MNVLLRKKYKERLIRIIKDSEKILYCSARRNWALINDGVLKLQSLLYDTVLNYIQVTVQKGYWYNLGTAGTTISEKETRISNQLAMRSLLCRVYRVVEAWGEQVVFDLHNI